MLISNLAVTEIRPSLPRVSDMVGIRQKQRAALTPDEG